MSQKYSDFAIYDKLYCEIAGLSLNRSNLSPNKSLPERVQIANGGSEFFLRAASSLSASVPVTAALHCSWRRRIGLGESRQGPSGLMDTHQVLGRIRSFIAPTGNLLLLTISNPHPSREAALRQFKQSSSGEIPLRG